MYKLFKKEWTLNTVKYWGKKQDYVSDEEQTLFKEMLTKQSNNYLQWALKSLSMWEQPEVPKRTKIIQISGALDKTFPIKLIDKPTYRIEDGAHFMVYRKAFVIKEMIQSILEKK